MIKRKSKPKQKNIEKLNRYLKKVNVNRIIKK